MEESEPVALIDMDGTIADFESALRQELTLLRGPNEPCLDELFLMGRNNTPAWFDARKSLVKKMPGFWASLEPIIEGFLVLDKLREHGFDLNILTKGPRRSTNAWTEKTEWCHEHVPDAKITISEDKGLVYGKVLFDDWPPYIERWLEWRPRGLVIMLDHRYNRSFNHPNVFRVKRFTPEDKDWSDQFWMEHLAALDTRIKEARYR